MRRKTLTWKDIEKDVKKLAFRVSGYRPQVIVGIPRGGSIVATLLSYHLQLLSHRLRSRTRSYLVHYPRSPLKYDKFGVPVISERPDPIVAGKRVLVVDEGQITGVTINTVCRIVKEAGAARIRTAVLYVIGKITDKPPDYFAHDELSQLVRYPWKRFLGVSWKESRFMSSTSRDLSSTRFTFPHELEKAGQVLAEEVSRRHSMRMARTADRGFHLFDSETSVYIKDPNPRSVSVMVIPWVAPRHIPSVDVSRNVKDKILRTVSQILRKHVQKATI